MASTARSSQRLPLLIVGRTVSSPADDGAVPDHPEDRESGEQFLGVPASRRGLLDRPAVIRLTVRELYEIPGIAPHANRALPANRRLADAEAGQPTGGLTAGGGDITGGPPEVDRAGRAQAARVSASTGPPSSDRPGRPGRLAVVNGSVPAQRPRLASGARSRRQDPVDSALPGPPDPSLVQRDAIGVGVGHEQRGEPGGVGLARSEPMVAAGAEQLGEPDPASGATGRDRPPSATGRSGAGPAESATPAARRSRHLGRLAGCDADQFVVRGGEDGVRDSAPRPDLRGSRPSWCRPACVPASDDRAGRPHR